MAKQTTLKVNTSLDNKLKKITEMAEEAIRDRLEHIANYTTVISPVETGAYVESFSFAVGVGRPRGKSSANRPKADRENAKNKGRKNLYEDIDKIDLLKTDKVTLRNGAPHVEDVEKKHSVFTRVRNKFGG